ncbi:MAG: sodium:proton antiporter [bacterium]
MTRFATVFLLAVALMALPLSGMADDTNHQDTSAVQEMEASSSDSSHAEGVVTGVEQAADLAHGEGGEAHQGEEGIGQKLPIWSALPFVGILLSIALFPLLAPSFWHHHFPKISAFWSLVFAIPFLIAFKGDALNEILHIYLVDYIPFIILLLGLFTASGGIFLRGSLVGTPRVNFILLLIGTVLASWMGTTGAAMVMIRPLLRANRERKNVMHTVIFFIFLVANIGGSLTPLGDPPLFLGFLHGVPFFWTFHIFPEFATAAGLLLILYFILDNFLYRKEKGNTPEPVSSEKVPLSLAGSHNFLFLIGIIIGVLFSGSVKLAIVNVLGVHMPLQNLIRDLWILLMVFLSVRTTKKEIRKDNGFTWFPILEVAYLFAGIFMTIIPALAMLRAGTSGHLAAVVNFVHEPFHYFWVTGALSSFLDNAPTYLTFYNLAQGRYGVNDHMVNMMLLGQASPGFLASFVWDLKAISVGAVFFGSMTYNGNAPNFMVRSIAEENHIKMPSFFGYMIWSLGILIPVFVLITLIFFI